MADTSRDNLITDGGVDEERVNETEAGEGQVGADVSADDRQIEAPSDSTGGSFIDEDGRLFGLVNIVDTLVILVVVAIAVAGVALVAGSGGGELETRYVTVEAGVQPDHVASQITSGDEFATDGSVGELTITDVYRYAPSEVDSGASGDVGIVIQARVNGTAIESESETAAQTGPIEFGGEPLRFGRSLSITTDEYAIETEIIDINQEPTGLNTGSRSLVVQTEVESTTAAAIQPGDVYRLSGNPIVTVESVTVYPTGNPNRRRVVLGVTAETRSVGERVVFGQRSLQTGDILSIGTDRYNLDARIIRQGSLEEPGVPATRTVTVSFDRLSPDRAELITAGMVESARETTTATVVTKTEQPAEVLLQTSGGFRFIQHPVDRDMELTLEISVQVRDDGSIRFRGESLLVGQNLRLELGGTIIEGEVTRIE